MLKFLYNSNKIVTNYSSKNKNITILIIYFLIIVMILIIFWNIFTSILKGFEGFDPNAPAPINVPISVYITDNTKSTNQIDPNAAGTFYLTTENNIGMLNVINMGADPSSVNINFDGKSLTKLLIYPTRMPQKNIHKANIFPVSFNLDILLSNTSGNKSAKSNITTKYIDISGDDYRNSVQYYSSPNGDVSGNFANIIIAVPNVQNPIYTSKNSETDLGYVQKPSDNQISITVDNNGNMIDGFLIYLNPPT
jgi:hypothetical protein